MKTQLSTGAVLKPGLKYDYWFLQGKSLNEIIIAHKENYFCHRGVKKGAIEITEA